MSYKDKYLKINKAYGESIRTQRINDTIRKLKYVFKDSPSYSKVNMYKPEFINKVFEVDSQIVDNSDTKDEKKITTFNEVDLRSGNYIFYLNKYWLVTHFDELGEIYKRGIMNRCYTTLRWQDKDDGEIKEAWFSRKTDVSPNFGIDDRKIIITMPDERRQIVVQSNHQTQKLRKEQRFLIDGRAWKIITLDDIADGIINIVLQEDRINSANDNEELRVADYNKIVYGLEMLNKESNSIYVGQSLQLNIKATKNYQSIDLNEITISSSNEEIGIVDNLGLFKPVSQGKTTITVQYMDMIDTLEIIVRDIIVNNQTVDIIGKDSIQFGRTEDYVASFKNNGIEINESCEFEIDGARGLVEIMSINDNLITLKANNINKAGNAILKVKNLSGTIKGEKNIRIKGFL